jgi:PAN domain
LYAATGGQFRVQACQNNSYGVEEETFGLAAAPCQPCPSGMHTTPTLPSVQYRHEVGPFFVYFHPLACVTKPGNGYDGFSATPCEAGSYSSGNDHAPCTSCGHGKTTADAAATSQNNCIVAPGYGNAQGDPSASVTECPLNTYNAGPGAICSPCLTGSGTRDVAATALEECDICDDGYGVQEDGNGMSSCRSCPANFYGSRLDRAPSDQSCQACPDVVSGYMFSYNGADIQYTPSVISRASSKTSSDCLAQFAQFSKVVSVDTTPMSSSWLWGANVAAPEAAEHADDCARQCEANARCHFFTFDYAQENEMQKCKLFAPPATPASAGTLGVLAYKAAPSSNVGASSRKGDVKSKMLGVGTFTQWTYNDTIDGPAPGGHLVQFPGLTKSECLTRCDQDVNCVLVYMRSARLFDDGPAGECILRASQHHSSMRSLTRAVLDQLVSSTTGPLPPVQDAAPPPPPPPMLPAPPPPPPPPRVSISDLSVHAANPPLWQAESVPAWCLRMCDEVGD